jgi:hypothetical protein
MKLKTLTLPATGGGGLIVASVHKQQQMSDVLEAIIDRVLCRAKL